MSGELDIAAVAPVERALARGTSAETDHVVFDLRNVSFLDLCGLEMLVRADAREAFAVEVVPPPGLTARLFRLTAPGRALTLIRGLP